MDSLEARETDRIDSSEIAIIGMACRFPGARDLETFWENVRDGVESITFLTDEELEPSGIDPAALNDPNYVKAASILEDVELFDAGFFGFTPKEAEVMDPQQRVFLECAWEALEHAGYDTETYQGLIGVYAGARTNTYLFNLYSNHEIVRSLGAFQIGLGNDLAFLTTRLSYKLDLKGPSCSIHTACSTSLVAIHLACQSLLIDECQIALAGGVAVNIPQKTGYHYQPGGLLSPDGHCRAFDASTQGTIFGSGVGIVVLKRLEDARADGDCIHAVIKGSAINNDGAVKASFTSPSVYSQTEVILDALASAEVEAETITYVEAHGTGTPLGDPIEIRALTKAFRASTDKTGFCAIGSVKTNVGHLDAAAGMASLIKIVLALKHRQIPPSLHFHAPNPQIDFASSPFYVNTLLTDWKAHGTPRRAGVSSFGIGGTNAHVILEEASAVAVSSDARPWHLLVLSAKTHSALETATANLARHLQQHPQLNLADVAYTLHVGRRAFTHRRMLVCQGGDPNGSASALLDPQRVFTSIQETDDPPVVFLFPGQGAQYARMALDLYQSEPTFREQVDHCAELLKPHLGRDIREIIFDDQDKQTRRQGDSPDTETKRQGDKEIEALRVSLSPALPVSLSPGLIDGALLNQTQYTQPALFVVEYALAQLWMNWGVQPKAMLGHSIGEYVAACLAGVFSLEDALALVAVRGRMMQALPGGAMLAVSLAEHELQPLLGTHLSLAAINGSALCVAAGTTDAVAELAQQLAAKGVECRCLSTSHAFHSQMMEPIVALFAEHVGRVALRTPHIPYISNVTGTWITEEEATDPHYWALQLRQTVRFADGLGNVLKAPGRILLEVGPGRTLSRLARGHPQNTPGRLVLASLRHWNDPQPDVASLLTTLGRLWLAGVRVHWPRMYAHERRQRLVLPTYPFERQRYWVEPQDQAAGAIRRPASIDKQRDIADWFYIPSWQHAPLPELDGPEEPADQTRRWLVFVDTCGLGAGLLKRLEQAGQDVIQVTVGAQWGRIDEGVYSINPRSRDDYDTLLAELRAADKTPTTIMHLWSMTPDDHTASGGEFFEQAQITGYYSLLYLAQALGKAALPGQLQISVVSNQVHEISGEAPTRPEKATLLGPCKVIPQEYPDIICRCIDVTVPKPGTRQEARLIDQLLAESAAQSPDVVIAYRGDRRWIQRFEPARQTDHSGLIRPLRERGVYLITGGLGGIGLLLAEYLARTVRARLVLTGRSGLPDRDEWEHWLTTHDDRDSISRKIRNVCAVEELGAEVLILRADVSNVADMSSVLAQIDERFGTLNGVIHAAGLTSGTSVFTPIAEIGPTESRLQFQPKVYGVYVLEEVLRGKSLDFCLLFSSNAAVLGGLGFIAYAAANLFMDAFAADRGKTGQVPWISANWDHWPEETRQYTGFQTSMDQYTMTLPESLEAFRRVAATALQGQVVISTGDLAARLGLWVNRTRSARGSADGVASPVVHPRPDIQSNYVAPRNAIEQTIAEIWQQILGVEQVGVYDSFFDLGGHSLLATQVIAHTRQTFHVELPLPIFFETPTVVGLARAVESASRTEQADIEKIMHMLSSVKQLSPDEVEAALAQRSQKNTGRVA